jgi:hypothetical protein
MMRGGAAAVDVDLTGAKELWLLVENVDSYDPSRVVAGWANAALTGPGGVVPLAKLQPTVRDLRQKEETLTAVAAPIPAVFRIPLDGKYTRFRAVAAVDDRSRASDIGPAVRFFVFTRQPDAEQRIRIQGEPPSRPPKTDWTPAELTERLYLQMLGRAPHRAERKLAAAMLGSPVAASGLEDLLWALLMSPEFQYIH